MTGLTEPTGGTRLARWRRGLWRSRFGAVAGGALVIAMLVVLSAHSRVGITADEGVHVEAGLQWLDGGRWFYTISPENPPLPRVAVAALPRLAGYHSGRAPNALAAMESDDPSVLTLARLGVLPFFLASSVLLYLIARRIHDSAVAMASTIGFVVTPAVLAHAGLATTDVPLVGTFLFATWATLRWAGRPGPWSAALVGLAIGLTALTKFSGLLVIPCVAIAAMLARRTSEVSRATMRRRVAAGAALIVTAAIVLWGGYRFSMGSIARANWDPARVAFAVDTCSLSRPGGAMRGLVTRLERVTLPAPELAVGMLDLCAHNATGHRSYFGGEISNDGFFAYYPVALAAKTPLPLLALAIAGAIWSWRAGGLGRKRLLPIAFIALILGTAVLLRINIGVRHILVIYPFISILAGYAVVEIWRRTTARRLARLVLCAGLAIQVIAIATTYPDYIAYFNVTFARRDRPVLLDSDLDWGQGLPVLERVARERKIDRLAIAYFGATNLCRRALPALTWLRPHHRVSGWIAISEMYRQGVIQGYFPDASLCDRTRYSWTATGEDGYRWLDAYEPVELLAGGAIRLYFIP